MHKTKFGTVCMAKMFPLKSFISAWILSLAGVVLCFDEGVMVETGAEGELDEDEGVSDWGSEGGEVDSLLYQLSLMQLMRLT